MSWVFDSGLAGPIRTLVRAAFIARLEPLKAPVGYLEAIIPLGFQVRDHQEETIDLLHTELGTRSPAIGIALLDQDFESAGAQGYNRGTLDVELYFVSSHRRGLTEGRIASDFAGSASKTRDPGLDTTLELAFLLLEQQDLALGTQVQVPRLRREHPVIASDELTLWRQHWQVIVTRNVNLNRDITQKVTEFVSRLRGAEPDTLNIQLDTPTGIT